MEAKQIEPLYYYVVNSSYCACRCTSPATYRHTCWSGLTEHCVVEWTVPAKQKPCTDGRRTRQIDYVNKARWPSNFISIAREMTYPFSLIFFCLSSVYGAQLRPWLRSYPHIHQSGIEERLISNRVQKNFRRRSNMRSRAEN